MGGIGFAPLRPLKLTVDELLQVRFNLDNSRRTEILRRVVVRSQRNGIVGTQFYDVQFYDKDIGFYLMP